MKEKNTLANADKVISLARSKGYKIFMAPITFSKDFRELSKSPYGILAGVKNGECFIGSEWGGQYNDSFKPQGNDVVVLGKTGLCAFASTNLDFLLRQVWLYDLSSHLLLLT
jgi:nicotinamidase-related amidase